MTAATAAAQRPVEPPPMTATRLRASTFPYDAVDGDRQWLDDSCVSWLDTSGKRSGGVLSGARVGHRPHEFAGWLADGRPVAVEALAPCGACPACLRGDITRVPGGRAMVYFPSPESSDEPEIEEVYVVSAGARTGDANHHALSAGERHIRRNRRTATNTHRWRRQGVSGPSTPAPQLRHRLPNRARRRASQCRRFGSPFIGRETRR